MKAWFAPLPGRDVRQQTGRISLWDAYAVMPVSREGWAITAAYFVAQIGGAAAASLALNGYSWAPVWVVAQAVALHIAFLRLALRHGGKGA
jgi:hypothetical protein